MLVLGLKKPGVSCQSWMHPTPSSTSFMCLVGEEGAEGPGALSYLAMAELSLAVVTSCQGSANLAS